MAIVRRNPPMWAVHMVILVPSDFVLRDRFGAQVDETTFMQGVEASMLRVRQFYYDMTGGKTFDVVPATFFRLSKNSAQVFSQDVTWDNAIKAGLAEMAARGYTHLGPNRLILAAIPLDLEGSGIAVAGTDIGSAWFQWGSAWTAGQNPKIFGGLLPDVASGIATIASTTSSGESNIILSSGGGRILAVAARFNRDKSRVQTVTGGATTATQMTLNDVGWITSTPMDAVIWPYGPAKPSVANAEAVVITAVNTSTRLITVQRAQKGTTAIAVTGGDYNNGGSVIARRQQYARIWRPPASPEATGAECVFIQTISGDTITVVRNEQDAWFAGNPPAARALQPGDNIVATDTPSGNFYQRIESAQGGIAHELGHNFGMKWWNPTEVRNFQMVVDGQVVTVDRRLSETARKSPDAVQGQDWWETLVHTPDNPATPGNHNGIMWSYWDFPFGNVPANMVQANELARLLATPYLRTQARPDQATQVTSDSFRSSTGPVAPPPVEVEEGSGGTVYTVQPVIVLAANSVPTLTDAELIANLTTSLENVQDYYTTQTGLTFSFRTPVITRHADTEADHNDDPGYGVFELATATAAVPEGANEDLLYAVFAWYPQPGENPSRSGWRGDAWAYANGPAYMSDRGARRLMGEVPDTLVTNSPGTGGTTITVTAGSGLRISRNADVPALPITARVYGPGGSFDNAGTYEVVTITNIVGDSFTVTRAGAPRSIAAGDRLAVANPGDTTAANLAVARGALAHELGHAFHLPHPWDNSSDPGPVEAGAVFRLMGNGFRQYPNALITAYEKAKMTQPANPPWLGTTGGGSGGSGGSGAYVVNPIAFWASDTANSTVSFPPSHGYTLPRSAAAFVTEMDVVVLRIRRYFWDRLREGSGGYTFTANPARLVTSSRTTAQIMADPGYSDYRYVRDALVEADAAHAGIDASDVRQFNALVMPMPSGISSNGAGGQAFHYNPYPTVQVDIAGGEPPFFCGMWNSIPGGFPTFYKGTALGAPRPDGVGDEAETSIILYAHELAHVLGYDAFSRQMLPHQDSPTGNLMNSGTFVTTLEATSLTSTQVARLKANPFMTLHAARP